MSRALANRSQFSFRGEVFFATSVSVDSPAAEYVDMTSATDPVGTSLIVPTGARTGPGKISVDAMGFKNPESLIGLAGQATFTTPLGSISRRAICESASVEGSVGEALKIRFSLVLTDYTGE
jgi:hypothetical protein